MQPPVYKYITLSTGEIVQAFALVDEDGNQVVPSTTSLITGSVANYAALPTGSEHTGELWYAEAGSGGYMTWLGVYKYPKGIYSPNGSDVWELIPLNVKLSEDAMSLVNITNWAEYFSYNTDIFTGDQIVYNSINYTNLTGTITSTNPESDTTNWRPLGLPISGANYYVSSSAETTIGTIDTPVKIAGTTAEILSSLDITVGTNRITFTGLYARHFKLDGSISLTAAGNLKDFSIYIAKNGTIVSATRQQRHIGTGVDIGNMSITGVLELDTNDYIEIWIENNTDATNVTIEFMNIAVMSIN